MKILKFDDEQEWLEARKTKITGSKKIMPKRGIAPLVGYYELIAERLALPATDENPMDRGHELEKEAVLRFEKETGKKVNDDLIILVREDNESIAISPDGMIGETEAVEVKCLASARHIEAYLKQEIPSDYEHQVLQYFVVNEKLETLYFCFYDPRLSAKDFFFIEVNRIDIQTKIDKYLAYQKNIIEQVNNIVNNLTF